MNPRMIIIRTSSDRKENKIGKNKKKFDFHFFILSLYLETPPESHNWLTLKFFALFYLNSENPLIPI